MPERDIIIRIKFNIMSGFFRNNNMLWTIAIILLVLWVLGFVTSSTFGGGIHVLLVIAVVVIVIQLLQGRRIL